MTATCEAQPTSADDTATHPMGADLVAEMPHLRRYAITLTRRADQADDLVQECLCKAMAAAHTFRPGTNLRAWLFRILRNAFISGLRRSSRQAPMPETEYHPPALQSHADPASTVELKEVNQAITELPQDQRAVLVLVVNRGLSYQEAAQIMDSPVGTVRSRLSRARESLRARLN